MRRRRAVLAAAGAAGAAAAAARRCPSTARRVALADFDAGPLLWGGESRRASAGVLARAVGIGIYPRAASGARDAQRKECFARAPNLLVVDYASPAKKIIEVPATYELEAPGRRQRNSWFAQFVQAQCRRVSCRKQRCHCWQPLHSAAPRHCSTARRRGAPLDWRRRSATTPPAASVARNRSSSRACGGTRTPR